MRPFALRKKAAEIGHSQKQMADFGRQDKPSAQGAFPLRCRHALRVSSISG